MAETMNAGKMIGDQIFRTYSFRSSSLTSVGVAEDANKLQVGMLHFTSAIISLLLSVGVGMLIVVLVAAVVGQERTVGPDVSCLSTVPADDLPVATITAGLPLKRSLVLTTSGLLAMTSRFMSI